MKQNIRFFILFEAATFIIAALIHAGVFITDYEHQKACIAESVIAIVLVAGLLVNWIRPVWTRGAGLVVQGFAFLGTCVGIFMVAIGVGPQTAPDLLYHALILIVLARGLVVANRAQFDRKTKQL